MPVQFTDNERLLWGIPSNMLNAPISVRKYECTALGILPAWLIKLANGKQTGAYVDPFSNSRTYYWK
jgi:hypothetical protein